MYNDDMDIIIRFEVTRMDSGISDIRIKLVDFVTADDIEFFSNLDSGRAKYMYTEFGFLFPVPKAAKMCSFQRAYNICYTLFGEGHRSVNFIYDHAVSAEFGGEICKK